MRPIHRLWTWESACRLLLMWQHLSSWRVRNLWHQHPRTEQGQCCCPATLQLLRCWGAGGTMWHQDKAICLHWLNQVLERRGCKYKNVNRQHLVSQEWKEKACLKLTNSVCHHNCWKALTCPLLSKTDWLIHLSTDAKHPHSLRMMKHKTHTHTVLRQFSKLRNNIHLSVPFLSCATCKDL